MIRRTLWLGLLIACLALGVSGIYAQDDSFSLPDLTIVLTPFTAETEDGINRARLYRQLVTDGAGNVAVDLIVIESEARPASHAEARALAAEHQAAIVAWGDGDAMRLSLTLDEGGAYRQLAYDRQVIYSQLAPLDQVDFVLRDSRDRQWAREFITALSSTITEQVEFIYQMLRYWESAADTPAYDREPALGDTSRAALEFYRASVSLFPFLFLTDNIPSDFTRIAAAARAGFEDATEALSDDADPLVRAALIHNLALIQIRILGQYGSSGDFIARGRLLTAIRSLDEAFALLPADADPLHAARSLRLRAGGWSLLAVPEDDLADAESPAARVLADLDAAIELIPVDRAPVAYAAAQNDRGSYLQLRYLWSGDIALLRDAADAFDAAIMSADIDPIAAFESNRRAGDTFLRLAYADDPLWFRIAARAFREALAISPDAIDPVDRARVSATLADASINVAYLTDDTGGLDEVLDALSETTDNLSRRNEPLVYAEAQQARGAIWFAYARLDENRGAVDEAIVFFDDAVNLLRVQRAFAEAGSALVTLANAYMLAADQDNDPEANLNRAADALEEALELAESYGGITITFAQIDLASVLVRLADYGQERALLRRAVDLFEAGLEFPPNSPFAEGDAWRTLGDAYLRLGEELSACSAWSRAAAAFTAGGARVVAVEINNQAGEFCPDAELPDLGRARGELESGAQEATIPIGGSTYWTYSGQAGEVITVRVAAENPSNNSRDRTGTLDTVVRIYAPDGSLLAEEDDILNGTITDSEIIDLELPFSGVYRIEVTSFNGDTGGRFTLTLTTRART